MAKRKLLKLSKLKKKAEGVFHKWIVLRDHGECYTCDSPGNQAGHHFHGKLDFSPYNLHCQCARCNLYLSGNQTEYTYRLMNELGQERYDALKRESNIPRRYTREELNGYIEYYQNLIDNFKEEECEDF